MTHSPFKVQSSGQGSELSSAGSVFIEGVATFTATFSLAATFPSELDEVEAEQPESPGQHDGEMAIFSVGP